MIRLLELPESTNTQILVLPNLTCIFVGVGDPSVGEMGFTVKSLSESIFVPSVLALRENIFFCSLYCVCSLSAVVLTFQLLFFRVKLNLQTSTRWTGLFHLLHICPIA